MLPSLQLPVGALFTVTARIKYFVVPENQESCDIVIVSRDQTFNKLAYDTLKNVLKETETKINTVDMKVQASVFKKILPHMNMSIDDLEVNQAMSESIDNYVLDQHLSVSIRGYVVSQLHVPGRSANEVSSYLRKNLFEARLKESAFSDHSIVSDFVKVRVHDDEVYEF